MLVNLILLRFQANPDDNRINIAMGEQDFHVVMNVTGEIIDMTSPIEHTLIRSFIPKLPKFPFKLCFAFQARYLPISDDITDPALNLFITSLRKVPNSIFEEDPFVDEIDLSNYDFEELCNKLQYSIEVC